MEHELGLSRVVGVGASAGGVDALMRVVEGLPPDVPAAFCVVLHVPATGRSLLPEILARKTELAVSVPDDGEIVRPGRIYVAPPDQHLAVAGGRLWLGRGPKENGVRPAVDPMLRSLAATYGHHAVAVILSGALGDGSEGASSSSRRAAPWSCRTLTTRRCRACPRARSARSATSMRCSRRARSGRRSSASRGAPRRYERS